MLPQPGQQQRAAAHTASAAGDARAGSPAKRNGPHRRVPPAARPAAVAGPLCSIAAAAHTRSNTMFMCCMLFCVGLCRLLSLLQGWAFMRASIIMLKHI